MMAFIHGGCRLLSVLLVVICFAQCVFSQKSTWKTLDGSAPRVIGRGGMSGLFPDATIAAYQFSQQYGFEDTVMYCEVQLTKDGTGVCRPNLTLDASTNIGMVLPSKTETYSVNGSPVTGNFTLSYTAKDVLRLMGRQMLISRTFLFDDAFSVIRPGDINATLPVEPLIWLNLQYPSFYEQHNLSMASYLKAESKFYLINYISSPEVEFLRTISPLFKASKSKLILKFQGMKDVDPSTNVTYGSLLKNLTFVKTFASGILVPKEYIFPTQKLYLQPPTSLVQDAHDAGLEIYASGFVSDATTGMSYNYSHDPVKEYLQFSTNNNNFSVDGYLTDFPVTASEAIGCYSHSTGVSTKAVSPLIITRNGDSGDFPGSTDIAYQTAVSNGADVIDCNVQITKDGVVFCRESVDLSIGTQIQQSSFYPSRAVTVPQVAGTTIYTFDLTWKEIQTVIPQTINPFKENYNLIRNPAQENSGKYLTLSEYLDFVAKQKNVSVLIQLEHVRGIIEARNLDLLNSTLKVLSDPKYVAMAEKIMIMSNETAVLETLKQSTKFKLIYEVTMLNVGITDAVIKQIKEYADVVALTRSAILPANGPSFFISGLSDVVARMHRQNMTVYAYEFRNEWPALANDYLFNARTELHTFLVLGKVDGLITQFPATAKAYLENSCGIGGEAKKGTFTLYLPQLRAFTSIWPKEDVPAPLSSPPAMPSIAEAPLPVAEAPSSTPSEGLPPPASPPKSPSTSSPPLTPPFLTNLFLILSGLYALFSLV